MTLYPLGSSKNSFHVMMLTLLTWLLVVSFGAGVPHAVCPDRTIEAAQGDDVSLPCHLDPPLNLTAHTVEWRRELDRSVVHSYRHGQDNPHPQSDRYRGRTALNHGRLGRGDLTLLMSSVQPSDSATYRCFVTKGHSCRANCTIRLIVVQKAQQNLTNRGDSSTSGPPVEPGTEKVSCDAASTEAVIPIVVGVVVVVFAAGLIFFLVKSRKIQICRKTLRGMKEQEETTSNSSETKKLRTQTTEGDEDPANAPENGSRELQGGRGQ